MEMPRVLSLHAGIASLLNQRPERFHLSGLCVLYKGNTSHTTGEYHVIQSDGSGEDLVVKFILESILLMHSGVLRVPLGPQIFIHVGTPNSRVMG